MKQTVFSLLLAACVAAVSAQTPRKPATHATRPAMATHSAAHAAASKTVSRIPRVHGIIKTAFSLRYEDYKIGTGPVAEPNKLYHVLYTGYLESTGQIFDSSEDHRRPVMKDGKPEMGPDGKPVLGPPEPLVFPQGFGRLIPGFDQGFAGMRIGGKRRLFIPWQLAYGTRNIPAHGAEHPGIPPKSNLIFDVTLLDVTDLPTPERPMNFRPHPRLPAHPLPEHPVPEQPGHPAAPSAAPAAKAPAAPATPAKPAAPGSTAPAATAPAAGSTAQPQSK